MPTAMDFWMRRKSGRFFSEGTSAGRKGAAAKEIGQTVADRPPRETTNPRMKRPKTGKIARTRSNGQVGPRRDLYARCGPVDFVQPGRVTFWKRVTLAIAGCRIPSGLANPEANRVV